jgi:hypothetical protein
MVQEHFQFGTIVNVMSAKGLESVAAAFTGDQFRFLVGADTYDGPSQN